jgi:shikimate kinase
MSIALIGFRGTGKSTVARLLALALGWDWVDADVEVELRAGKSITAIFADQGEDWFRALEAQVLTDFCDRSTIVLAAGGGAVVRPDNRAALKRTGAVVWLTAPPETLWERIRADRSTAERRPGLTSLGGLEEVRMLLERREPLYRESADLQVSTSGKTPDDVCQEIALWHRHRQQCSSSAGAILNNPGPPAGAA